MCAARGCGPKGYSDEIVEAGRMRYCRKLTRGCTLPTTVGCAKLRCNLSELRSTQSATRMCTRTDHLSDLLRYQAARRNSVPEHVRVSRYGERAPGGRREAAAGGGRRASGADDPAPRRTPIPNCSSFFTPSSRGIILMDSPVSWTPTWPMQQQRWRQRSRPPPVA